MTSLYPWHASIWTQLMGDQTRLPHALVLHGRSGTGKFDFAMQFCEALLCRTPRADHTPCGTCASCTWFQEAAHPDFKLLSPEQDAEPEEGALSTKKSKKKANISVAQIRELSDFLNMSSHQSSGLKIVLLHPAESLNLASANALLKMLEEPAKGVMFVLVTHQIQRLLPTILSRCQKIGMPTPATSDASAWLALKQVNDASAQLAYFEGSPIKVLNEQAQFAQMKDVWRMLAQGNQLNAFLTAQTLLACFTSGSGNAVEGALTALQKWLYDIAHCRFVGQTRYHPQLISTFQKLAENVHLNALFNLQKTVLGLRKLAAHPLNHELQLEAVLQDYAKIFAK